MTKKRALALEQLLVVAEKTCKQLHETAFSPAARRRISQAVIPPEPKSATEATRLMDYPKPQWLIELESAVWLVLRSPKEGE